MQTEFVNYCISGWFVCMCGQQHVCVGIVDWTTEFECEICKRKYRIARPKIELVDQEGG